jgi:hypothetical protein
MQSHLYIDRLWQILDDIPTERESWVFIQKEKVSTGEYVIHLRKMLQIYNMIIRDIETII